MKSRFTAFVAVAVALAFASVAATVNASAAANATTVNATAGTSAAISAPTAAATKAKGSFELSYAIKQFFVRNGKLHVRGEAIAKVKTDSGTRVARKPFQTFVRGKAAAMRTPASLLQQQQLCTVLALALGPIHLELLGLIVDTNQIIVLIRADPTGGLLGDLLCDLPVGTAGGVAATSKVAQKLTQAARQSGLASGAVTTAEQEIVTQQLPPGPEGACTVLDLVIAPIHLELLGLIVDTSEIHIRILADPNGGLLGSLLCSPPAGTTAVPSG